MNKEKVIPFVYGLIGGSVAGTLIILLGAEKASLVAEWFSAIGTVAAVIVALYLANKEDKSCLNFYLHSGNLYVMNSGRGYSQIRIISVRVIDSKNESATYTDSQKFISYYDEVNKKYLTINPGNSVELVKIDVPALRSILGNHLELEINIEDMQNKNRLLIINERAGDLNVNALDRRPIPYG
jgi:uncharacterized DUF497 family protein